MGLIRSKQDVLSKTMGTDKAGADPVGAYFAFDPVETVVERARQFLKERNGHVLRFEQKYSVMAKAMQTLRSRAELWIRLLEDPDSVDPRVLAAAGKTNLGRRAAFAIHCAFEDAEKLSERMSDLTTEFLERSFRDVGKPSSESQIVSFPRWGSPCETTGVCVCRCVPPYQVSCLGGQDAILPHSPEQLEEIARRFSEGLSDTLKMLHHDGEGDG